MKIGCPTEIKPQEFRVGLTPNAAQEAVAHGHEVVVQSGAGAGAGFEDADYSAAGATLLETAEEVFATADITPVLYFGFLASSLTFATVTYVALSKIKLI